MTGEPMLRLIANSLSLTNRHPVMAILRREGVREHGAIKSVV